MRLSYRVHRWEATQANRLTFVTRECTCVCCRRLVKCDYVVLSMPRADLLRQYVIKILIRTVLSSGIVYVVELCYFVLMYLTEGRESRVWAASGEALRVRIWSEWIHFFFMKAYSELIKMIKIHFVYRYRHMCLSYCDTWCLLWHYCTHTPFFFLLFQLWLLLHHRVNAYIAYFAVVMVSFKY